MRLTPGTRVGPYEVVASLGAGGMAEVYRARDARLGRDVALKVVSEALGSDDELVARFEREARLVGSLNHSNVVAVHDVGRHESRLSIWSMAKPDILIQTHWRGVMTVDLRYLAYTAILTAALWIPYIVAQVATNGLLTRENYVDPTPRPLPLWGKRADRTYLNAVEAFAPFAALVIIAHVTGKANAMTAFWAMCFFWLRLTHAAVYLLAIPYVRTVVFTLGFVSVAGIFWELVK